MGQNLILNAADHGFTVIAFNRTVSKVDRFLENEAKGMMENSHICRKVELTSFEASPLLVPTRLRSSVPSSRNLAV